MAEKTAPTGTTAGFLFARDRILMIWMARDIGFASLGVLRWSKVANSEHGQGMSVRLYQIDTVVIGHFNPHIISPPWLANQGIIGEGSIVEAKVAIAGRAVAFQFKIGEILWQVDFNRLILSAERKVNTAEIVAKVLSNLPHTPVTAIGNNFRFQCNLSQWKGRVPKLGDVGFEQLRDQVEEVQSVAWKASIGKPDGLTINTEVTLEPSKSLSPMLTVNFNFHRDAPDAQSVIDASTHFEEDERASAALFESLLLVRIDL
jgi:hypothetical protein